MLCHLRRRYASGGAVEWLRALNGSGVAAAIADAEGAVVGGTIAEETTDDGDAPGGTFDLPFDPFGDN